MTGPVPDRIVSNLVSFASLLRRRGVEVGVARVRDAIRALEHVPLEDHEGVYWALRCVLTQRQQDLEAFDAAFAELWRESPSAAEEAPEAPEIQSSIGDVGEPSQATGDDAASEEGVAWSASERLRKMDFAAYGPEERRRANALVRRISLLLPLRPKRRLRSSSAQHYLDMRGTIRASTRTQGVPLTQVWSEPRLSPRKLLLILDVSGSMQTASRIVLMFLLAAVRADRRVEAFAFGTRLTRLTRHLRSRNANAALAKVAAEVQDWGGGTRIAEALLALNDTWGPRGVVRGAVVVIVSDGLEHGDPDLLAHEMARIHRSAHAVIWLNPLAGDAHYEPIAAGMAAALPYVDFFLPGQNLEALSSLAELLSAIPRRRSQVPGHDRRATSGRGQVALP